jgi:Nif-specific regulatory protein
MVQNERHTMESNLTNEKVMNPLNALIDLAFLLGQQSDFQEILRLVTRRAAELTGADRALIMMLNPQTRQTVKTVCSEGDDGAERKYRLAHTNISGWVIENNRPFSTDDFKRDPRFRKDLFKNSSIRSALCIPLRMEGIFVGTLLALNKTGADSFSADDQTLIEKLAAVAAPFLCNAQKIQQFFATVLPEQSLLKKYEAFGLLGKSKSFVQLLHAIESAARCSIRILLEGESGTGKELIARAIHRLGSRSQNKFLAVDIGAIPANLIESELFGHVRGAFTGAASDRRGLMEEADGGTLFMDEIANLPLDMQAKLLRVLQEGEIRPLGSNRTRKVDVRIISASSNSLRTLVDKQLFRDDLFYRLNVYPISVPSLGERREDIPLLANHFIRRFSQGQNKSIETIHGDLLDYLKQRNWRGNIRELENFIERLIALAPPGAKILDTTHLPKDNLKERDKLKRVVESDSTVQSLKASLAEVEERLMRKALSENGWNQSKAARALGISEQTIRYKMGKLGIVPPN